MRIFAGLPPPAAGAGLTRHVALLRAVNVGGSGRLAMADLRAAAAASGFADVATVLMSGTLIGAAEGNGAALERRLESSLSERLGLETAVMIRSAQRWRALLEGNPFEPMAERDPAHLLVVVLKEDAVTGGETALRAAIKGSERVAVVDGAVYVAYPEGIGRSKLTMAMIERHLGTRGTGRNWSTVLKIAAGVLD